MSVVRNRLPREKAIVAAKPQMVASIPRLPCACLHIVTRAESEESDGAATDAMEMHYAGDLFESICVIAKSKCIYGMPVSKKSRRIEKQHQTNRN
jgi:hypothetical protein